MPIGWFACRSRDEEEGGCGAGDGFHIVFVVIAVVSDQQVVEDAHDTHEEQEAEDALPKQVSRSAANTIMEGVEEGCTNMNGNKPDPTRSLVSGFTFVRSVPCIPQSTSASPLDR